MNRVWKKDYDKLLQENVQLKASLRMENTRNSRSMASDVNMIEGLAGLEDETEQVNDCFSTTTEEGFRSTFENIQIIEAQVITFSRSNLRNLRGR